MVFVRLSRIILNVRNLLDFIINVRLSRITLDQPKNYYFAGLPGKVFYVTTFEVRTRILKSDP